MKKHVTPAMEHRRKCGITTVQIILDDYAIVKRLKLAVGGKKYRVLGRLIRAGLQVMMLDPSIRGRMEALDQADRE